MDLRGGRYETLRVIASGGMATVHLGRALGAGGFERLVAIKTMHPHLAGESEFIAMFLDEARLAAQIRHPNVVGTIDVQQDDHGVFLVMEYIEGPSLQQILRGLHKNQATLPLDIALRVFLDALSGLHAAHELKDAQGAPLNLVHRDISPQNVLIGVDGVARITDFGVARAEARLSTTQGSQLKGKIGYMAPEQAARQTVDRRTDVYAAGVLLWELLALKRLIRGDSEIEMLAKVVASAHPSPRSLNPEVPEAIDAACKRALCKSPDDRYPSAADFAEAVDDAARSAGLKIASPRAVATFVQKLGVHAAPVDLPPSSLGSDPRASVPTLTAPDARVSAPALPPDAVPTRVTTPPAREALSDEGMSVPPSSPTARRVLTAPRALAGAAALLLLLGLFFWLRSPSTNDTPMNGSAPVSSERSASAPLAVSAAPVAASTQTISALATAEPAPSAALSAPLLSASSKSAAGAATTKQSASGSPGGTSTRGSGGPMYRPPDL